MLVLGDFTTADTLYVPFDTYDANGASVTISGLAVTDIEIYKDGSITQRASDNGYTLLDTDGIDFDGSTGLHGFSINLADNSDAGFYAAGSQYWLHVNAITVDAQTVKFTYYFTIGRLLKPTTAGRTIDVTAGGCAGIDWANVESQSTAVVLSQTDFNSATDVSNPVDVGTIAAGAVDTFWEYATASITTAGGIGKLIVDNLNATISSRASQTSVDDLPTNAELATSQAAADDATLAAIAALNNLSAAQVNAEVLDVLNVDTFAEIGQEAPAATQTIRKMLGYLYKSWRNKKTQTATERKLFADDATTVDQKATDSDDATTYTKGEVGTGP